MAVEKAATIEEVATQIGSTLLPDNERWTNRFQIESSSSNRKYIIAQQREDGVWGCSCPGWTHYRKCKHLTDVLRRLSELAERSPTFGHMTVLISARTAFLILETPTRKIKVTAPKGRQVDFD